MSYFIATCKYERMQENGAVKRVSEKYLCDALSIVEADAVVTENLKPYISGDFFTSKVENSPIAEVMGDKECGRFWLCKVAFITINEGMKGTLADFEIISLAETPIKEFYPAKL